MQYPQLAIWMWVVIVGEQHYTLKSKLLLPTSRQTTTPHHISHDKHYTNNTDNASQINKVCINPPGITVLMLPNRCCTLTQAADTDKKAAAINGTDSETPNHYIDPAPHTTRAASIQEQV